MEISHSVASSASLSNPHLVRFVQATFDASGSRLLAVDLQVLVPSGIQHRKFRLRRRHNWSVQRCDAFFSKDKNLIKRKAGYPASCFQGNVFVFNLAANSFSRVMCFGSACTAVAFSRRCVDEVMVATADASLKIINVATKEIVACLKVSGFAAEYQNCNGRNSPLRKLLSVVDL